MKLRREVDAEIWRENHAITQQEQKAYRWSKTKDREKRDEHIIELWEMGYSREVIAKVVDLTPQRVSQIVNSFGMGWR